MTPADVFPVRFARFVRVLPSGCWRWVGGHQSHAYGVYWDRAHRRAVLAHHAAHNFATGQMLLPGWILLHSCDVRDCVNPRHILPATVADNNLDCRRKGRWCGPHGPARAA